MSDDKKNDKSPAPIRVSQLLIASHNTAGIRVPHGNDKGDGGNNHLAHTLVAGERGDVRYDIEYRPWMRHFRVLRSEKLTRTENGKEVAEWKALGKPYYIHETHIGSWTPVDE